MRKAFLGLDTSNYKTSAALYFPDNGQWQSEGSLLPVKEGELGLRQSDALFLHLRQLPDIVKRLKVENVEIVGIGYSDRPRSLPDSYMPCFNAGASFAQSIAHILNVPCRAFSHQQGHIMSAAFSCGKVDMLKNPFYAWHLSGGTTELLRVSRNKGYLTVKIVGGTSDISAGQLIDRAGVACKMPFPAGPFVEQEALKSQKAERFKVKLNDSYFSLSGIQNKIEQMISKGEPACDVCSFTLLTVANAIVKATDNALKCENLPVLLSGGVSVCSFIQNAFSDHLKVYFAQQGLGGDNALGAALLCAESENCL